VINVASDGTTDGKAILDWLSGMTYSYIVTYSTKQPLALAVALAVAGLWQQCLTSVCLSVCHALFTSPSHLPAASMPHDSLGTHCSMAAMQVGYN